MADRTCTMPECGKPHRARGLCMSHYNKWKYHGDASAGVQTATACAHCGGAIPPKSNSGPPQTYCSRTCRSRADHARRRDEDNSNRRAAAAALRASVVKACPQCGAEFSPRVTSSQRFCSKRCSRAWKRANESGSCMESLCDRPVRAKGMCNKHYRAILRAEGRLQTRSPWTDERRDAWHRRRALKKSASTGAPVLLSEIAERDAWKCGLCSSPVDADLQWPHPFSKSLDHVKPLSRGGAHDPSNVQLAHLRCNTAKGNRVA